jgi:tRNA pseudouridine55 synthase
MNRRKRYGTPAPLRGTEPFDGVLFVDKPSGPTSHDIVDMIRRRFGIRKVGHGGTLDPQATGLLVILLGKGTKLSALFIGSDKTYEGTIYLGISTDTQDAQGKLLRQAESVSVTREQLEAEMGKLEGDIMQTPPMVSATKVDGVPLYKLARKGKTIEREPKLVHVYEFRLLDFRLPRAEFLLRCTKGTYVRTLCADVGEALGCGAHLEALRRLQCGDMRIEHATPVSEVLEMDRDELARRIMPVTRFQTR